LSRGGVGIGWPRETARPGYGRLERGGVDSRCHGGHAASSLSAPVALRACSAGRDASDEENRVEEGGGSWRRGGGRAFLSRHLARADGGPRVRGRAARLWS